MKKKLERPQIKRPEGLDSLFGLDDSKTITQLELHYLVSFKDHPFTLYEGERLDDMVESIKAHGVIVPIIVRNCNTDSESCKSCEVTKPCKVHEILAGHNRVNAARLAGLDEVPAIVLTDIDDETAMAYVVETNLMQRSFSDMRHSEKALVIALHHGRMFSENKRREVVRHIGENGHSDEAVAEEYNLSARVVSRYLRIHQLIPEVKQLLDSNTIPFMAAVDLSYLTQKEQVLIAERLEGNTYKLDIKKAAALRQKSSEKALDGEVVLTVLAGLDKPFQYPSSVKIKPSLYQLYFKNDQSIQEVQDIVERALEMYFSSTTTQ